MKRWGTESDYIITIGLGVCEGLVVNTNGLLCTLPPKEPNPSNDNARHEDGLHVYVSADTPAN